MPQLDRPIALTARPSRLVRFLRITTLIAVTVLVFIFGVAVTVVATSR